MRIPYFFVYYLMPKQVQSVASSAMDSLALRGGDISIDDSSLEKTQCNLEHECETAKSSLDVQTSISDKNTVDIEKEGTAGNFKIIEIVNNMDDDMTKRSVGSSRSDEFDTHRKSVQIGDSGGSFGKEYDGQSSDKKQGSSRLKVSGIQEDNKNLAFVSTSKSGRKSQILDHKISQTLYKRFSDATVSLQNLAKSQKPTVLHFAKELQERYGQSASTLSKMKSVSLKKVNQLKAVNVANIQQIVDDVAIRVKYLSSRSSLGIMNIMMNYRLGRESTLLLWNLSFSLLGASIGFVSFLYFVSVGYGLAIGTVALVLLLQGFYSNAKQVPFLTFLHTGLVALWAVRLVAFLLHREFISWPEWHDKVKEVHKRTNSQMKSYVWMTCGAFYSMMMYPCTNRMRNAIEQRKDITKWGAAGRTGLLLQILGLLLETVADYQKGEFKRKNGNRNKWCNVGLWSKFSHPNYLGEAIFWSGVFLGGAGCNKTARDWLISTTGLVFIFAVLKGAVESLESKHIKNYSQNPDFIEFRKQRYKISLQQE